MKFVKKLVSILLPHLPPDDERSYQLCQQYVDRYNGENNANMRTNGELHFMHEVLGDSRTVFDVGANVGEWAALALTINPALDLHCFEPSQGTYRRLLERAFPPNVRCVNLGFGSAREEKTLYVFEDGSGLNSLYKREGLEDGWGLQPQERTEIIKLDTMDHYCSEQGIDSIDLLKVDVEGHELEVFRGAARMLERRQIRAIQFEYGGCNVDARVMLKDLFAYLRPFGFTFYRMYPGELRRVERYDQRMENFRYQNWVVMLDD